MSHLASSGLTPVARYIRNANHVKETGFRPAHTGTDLILNVGLYGRVFLNLPRGEHKASPKGEKETQIQLRRYQTTKEPGMGYLMQWSRRTQG